MDTLREQKQELIKIVDKYLSHWTWSVLDKNIYCHLYVEQFGIDGVNGFIRFCKDKKMTDKITPTLAHDLNGVNDDFFLPKTSGYSKYERGVK